MKVGLLKENVCNFSAAGNYRCTEGLRHFRAGGESRCGAFSVDG